MCRVHTRGSTTITMDETCTAGGLSGPRGAACVGLVLYRSMTTVRRVLSSNEKALLENQTCMQGNF